MLIIPKADFVQFWSKQVGCRRMDLVNGFKGHTRRHVVASFDKIAATIQAHFESSWVPLKPAWVRRFAWAWSENNYIIASSDMSLYRVKCHNTASMQITEALRTLDKEFDLKQTR